jgi:hypothetical protein
MTFDAVTIIHFLDFVKGDDYFVSYIESGFFIPPYRGLFLVESTPGSGRMIGDGCGF